MHCQVSVPAIPHIALHFLKSMLSFISLSGLQHEKFTSGLQLSKKPSNGETTTTTTTGKSPTKTPSKTLKSPSGSTLKQGESRAKDGLASLKEPQTKPTDGHKAEERIGGERESNCLTNCMSFCFFWCILCQVQ